ncbi:g2443 [Coccomyxa elongata]
MIRTDSDPSLPPKIYGSVEFKAEALVEDSTTAGDKRDPETTLKLVGGMRREGYAVGVFVLALGLGAASTVTQAITTAGHKGARALGQAASVLDEQQKTSAHRAKQWLSGLMQQSEKQAVTAQESLEEWPDVLQQSYSGAVENHRQAMHHAQTNLRQWAEEYVPGTADVQRLWQTAAKAARQNISEAAQAARAPRDDRYIAADGPDYKPSSSGARVAGATASASTAPKQLPGESAAPGVRRRSETEVYAAESRASARAAEAHWNERIRAAYASVAAGTPFRPSSPKESPAENKPASHALSYARGANTTLLRSDFVPPSSGGRSTSGSGGGLGSGQGGSGGGSSGGGGDGDSGDEQQPERPHGFLFGRLLLLASAAVAAAEQLLEQPGKGSRLLAALALLGALLWQGQRMQRKRQGRRTRRSVSSRFSLSSAGHTNGLAAAADDLSDMSSDDEGF